MSGVHVVIGLTGLQSDSGGFSLQQDRMLKIAIPSELHAGHCDAVRRDFEMLAELAATHPESLEALHRAAIANDVPETTRVAREIGLTEDRFVAGGGGIWWALIGIAAAGLTIAALSESGETEHVPGPDHKPEPETELPGPSDAGVPGGT